MNEFVNIISDYGVTVVVLAYFLYRDWKFTQRLDTTLSTLQKSTDNIEMILKQRGGTIDTN